jgi:hypothetical protein
MLDHRAERERRNEGEGAHDEDDPEGATSFFCAREPATATTGTITPKRPTNIATAVVTL